MTGQQPPPAVDSAIGFGAGISDDHRHGIRWVDYTNISWNPVFCLQRRDGIGADGSRT
jgi:hypothetical protein